MENTTTQNQKLTPGFFFLSLGVIVTLITSVTAFLNLIFETLNKKFPDALNSTYTYGYNTYDTEGIRVALAILIIFFPVYLVTSYFWSRASRKELSHVDSIIRKWMIYLIIFIASILIAIDLVSLVQYFVSGEITTRFILKVLTALTVALIAGSYYVYELRLSMQSWAQKVYAIGVLVIVISAIVWSFMIIGSPAQQRVWRFDDRRVQDLQSIQSQVITYWQQKEKLPIELKDVVNAMNGYSVPVDPEFEKGNKYEYKATGKMTFELCANFGAPIPKGWQENKGGVVYAVPGNLGNDAVSSYPYPGTGTNESWSHEAGRTCFERTIDKDIYQPFPKTKN